MAVYRPPGALENENNFLEACTKCDECITACPHGAIHPISLPGTVYDLTPTLLPTQTPCQNCPDMPCIAACESGALDLSRVDQRIAILQFKPFNCISRAAYCVACEDACNERNAIDMTTGEPIVAPNACNGCGKCVTVCPAPNNAFAIKALPQRTVPYPEMT